MKTFFYLIFSALVGLSCNFPADNKMPTETSSIATPADTTNLHIWSKIGPNRFWVTKGSLWRVESWVLDHYEPQSGKLVGVWPDNYSNTRLTELYSKWGFRGVLVDQNTFWAAFNAGFKPSSMMVGMNGSNYQTVVQNYNARAYYIGEPTDHICYGSPPYSYGDLLTIGNYVRSYIPGAKFIIDGYRRCQHFIDAGRGAADFVMYSSYKHWFDIDPIYNECWLWTSEDQRQSWSDMQGLFGSRFMSTWISGWVSSSTCGYSSDYDGDEYSVLTGHATNLGLQEIWFFIGCGTSQNELTNFAYWSWRAGWLRRFERLTYLVYECTCNGGCYDFPPSDCWTYICTEQTDIFREVYP
jgi:hypothetical protein